jgi:hypothetical protein
VYYVLNTAGEDKSSLSPSDKNVYYILNTIGEDKSVLLSGDKEIKSNIAQIAEKHTRLPTLGDVIEFIPFLPIEINVPDVISSMINFFNWMINRRPQDQSNPRIYLLLKNHHGYGIYPFITKPTLPVFLYDSHLSYASFTRKLVLPADGAPSV